MSQLDIFSEAAPQFSMYTSYTLSEAHAPGRITTTFESSDTETETQPHSCLGMTAHPQEMLNDFTGLDSRHSPARDSFFVHSPSDLDTQATHPSIHFGPHNSIELPKDSESSRAS